MDSQLKSVDRQFLEESALQLNLTGDSLAAFLARFHRENATRENSTLVSFIAWNNQPEDGAQKLQDELARICKVLEENGCPINRPDGQKKRGRAPKGQSPWEQAYKWLWESRFPEWQRHNQQPVSEQGETGRNGQADIDSLIQQVRARLLPFITDPNGNLGTMRMPWVNRPVPVDEIYIHLNVLEKPSCSFHFSDWRQQYKPDNRQNFDRLGLSQVENKGGEAISVVKTYPKLMVLGKPGAGKTTFLKSLAVECIQPQSIFFADLVPLLVTLREFVKAAHRTQSWKLLDYLVCVLAEQWNGCDRANAKEILAQGRSLVLLDGLDEVPPGDLENVIDAVREFGYSINRLVITCRTQSQQDLDGFTDVEVADFTPEQVEGFVENWFKTVDSGSQKSLAPKLNQQLRATENKPIAELTVTPVLLNLICAVFRDEQGHLPKKRVELYTKGMRQLLERLKRTPIDERLTIDVKEEFLAELALMLFENNDYFPEQQTLESLISNYFRVKPSVARKILKLFETETGLLIERSAGYWSFSHLTFQEYFVAQWYVQNQDWQRLTCHVCDSRWRQVFLLAAEMVQPVDDLLWAMKREIDALIKNDNKLQQFINWVQEKAHSVTNARYKPSAVRAFYFYFANLEFSCIQELLHPKRDILAYAIDPRFRDDMSNAYAQRAGIFIFVFSLPNDIALDIALGFIFDDDTALLFALGAIELIFKLELTTQFKVELQFLVSLLPPRFQDWGKEKWETWLTCLKKTMIEHRKIGHDWQLTKKQKEQLQRYYDANKFLVECMNQPRVESEAMLGAIEQTLLLPV